MPKKTLEIRTEDSICADCADELGGKWPEGHCATHWVGKCGICSKTTNVVNVGDYNWPDKKHRGMRD